MPAACPDPALGIGTLIYCRRITELVDRIFPANPADGHALRLGLVGSWESQLIGLGRLTAFVSSSVLRRSHAVDDLGLNLVFLQRHRVEVGLKLILERSQSTILGSHNIQHLVDACKAACTTAEYAHAWSAFSASQAEYIALMHRVDPNAATYRYPVDKAARPWPRRQFVDLEELEVHGAAFQDMVLDLTRELAELEPLPVAAADAYSAACLLHELASACNSWVHMQERTIREARANRDMLLTRSRKTWSDEENADVYAASAAVADVTTALAARATAMRDRIVAAYKIDLPPDRPEQAVAPMPLLAPSFDVRATRAQAEAQMRWFVDELVKTIRPLSKTLHAARQATSRWSTPAARQVHLDIERFSSRIFMEAPGPTTGG